MYLLKKFFLVSDKILCSCLGFTSPWFSTKRHCQFCHLYSYILFLIPVIFGYFTKPWKIKYANSLLSYLELGMNAGVFIELYVSLYMYRLGNKQIFSFVETFFENELHLSEMFISCKAKPRMGNCFKFLIFYFVNWLAVATLSISVYKLITFTSLISLLRRVVSFCVTLQWSICMYHMDDNLDKIKCLLDNVLQPKIPNLECDFRSRVQIIHDERKFLDMERFDRVIGVYRMLAKKHRLLGEYYGLHILLSLSLLQYGSILLTYVTWFCIVKLHVHYWNIHFLVVIVLNSLGTILLITIICESARKKVSTVNLQFMSV